MLMGRPVLAPSESLPQLATLIKDHFDALAHLGARPGPPGDGGDPPLPATVRAHADLFAANPHVGTESGAPPAAGEPLAVCAVVDGRIQCLALGNN